MINCAINNNFKIQLIKLLFFPNNRLVLTETVWLTLWLKMIRLLESQDLVLKKCKNSKCKHLAPACCRNNLLKLSFVFWNRIRWNIYPTFNKMVEPINLKTESENNLTIYLFIIYNLLIYYYILIRSRFCTVHRWTMACNYQHFSWSGSGWESNSDLRGRRWVCYYCTTVSPLTTKQTRACTWQYFIWALPKFNPIGIKMSV